MSADDWRELDRLVEAMTDQTPTQPRAIGEAISTLIHAAQREGARPPDGVDRERRERTDEFNERTDRPARS